MHKQLIKKPIIIAICGKSASGKDTLVQQLVHTMELDFIDVNVIVSDTTRPPRRNEQDGINYNFLTEIEFHNKINDEQYLEYSNFNGWFYGTDYRAIDYNSINIGIFNIDGINSLAMYQNKYDIFCIYLQCNLYNRIKRSIQREGCFKIEYIRRILADNANFKQIDFTLMRFSNHLVVDTNKTFSYEAADHVIKMLKLQNLYFV